MAEPADILEKHHSLSSKEARPERQKMLITAGPTYEHLDPVRFIGNHSSGKMGLALAREAAGRSSNGGIGSRKITIPAGLTVVNVVSAKEMYEACDGILINRTS